MVSRVSVKVPYKISLLGDMFSFWETAPSLSIQISKKFKIRNYPSEGWVPIRKNNFSEYLFRHFNFSFNDIYTSNHNWKSSNIGGSTSLTIALTFLYASLNKIPVTYSKKLERWTYDIEKNYFIHTNFDISILDHRAILCGNCCIFPTMEVLYKFCKYLLQKDKGFYIMWELENMHRLHISPNKDKYYYYVTLPFPTKSWDIILIDIGSEVSTIEALIKHDKYSEKLIEENKETYEKYSKKSLDIVTRGIYSYSTGDFATLEKMMEAQTELIKGMDIIPKKELTMINKIYEAGLKSVKMTGCNYGGSLIGISEEGSNIEDKIRAIPGVINVERCTIIRKNSSNYEMIKIKKNEINE